MLREKFTLRSERTPKFASNFLGKKYDHYASKYDTSALTQRHDIFNVKQVLEGK